MDRSATSSKSGRATNNSVSGQLLEPLPSVLPSKSKYIKELARDPFVPAKKIAFEPPSIFVKAEEPNSILPAANTSNGKNDDDGVVDDGFADDGFADDGFADDGFADEGFADEVFADEGFADDGYADDDLAAKSYLAAPKGNDLAKEDLSRNVRADTEGFADDSDSASPKYAAAARVGKQALKGDDDEGFADEEEEEGFADDDLAVKAESIAVLLRKKQEVGDSPFADSEEDGFADDASPGLASRSIATVATGVSRMEGSSDEGFADDDVEAMEVQKMLEVAAPVSPEDEGFADDDDIPRWKLASIKPNPPKPAPPPPPKRKTRPPPPPPPKRPSFDKGRSVSASSSRSLPPRKSSTPMDLDHGFADGSASPPSSEFADDISTNSSSRGRSFKKPASVVKVVATPASNGSALVGLGAYKIPRMTKNVDVKSAGQALPPKGPRIDLPSQASPKNKSSSILPLPAPAPYRDPYYPNQQRNGHSSVPIASTSVQSPPPPTTAPTPPQPAMMAPAQAHPLAKAPAPAVATDPRRRKLNSDPHNNGFDQGSSSGIYVPLNRSVIFQKCQITDLFRRELKDDAKASRIHGDSEDTAITKLYQYWDIGNVAKNIHDFSEVMGVGTSEVRESWIYAPKKDGGGSNAKKVLADYYGLQLILSKLEGAKQTKSLEDSTRAVFVHVSEEEEIRKALAIKNPELIKLEQFRNKDVIFVLFGEKTFKQFWRKGMSITYSLSKSRPDIACYSCCRHSHS